MYPDCCFIVGDAEVSISPATSEGMAASGIPSGGRNKLTPAQWAALIAEIAAAIARILEQFGRGATLNATGGGAK